ncbi:MAG: response regulator transcription factor [Anaerolineae bacterium]|nr:response regulator transcription factor [Anaerolineae bacterium]
MPDHSHIILAVDSDSITRESVCHALRREGHYVIEADNAEFALNLALEHHPDIIILDAALTDMNVYELCARLRAVPHTSRASILFLSASQSAQHVARALDSGGDDYVRKPFVMSELNARVRALLRRIPHRNPLPDTVLRMVPVAYRVSINAQFIQLTPTEYHLLDYLCKHQGEYCPAVQLLEAVWNYPPGAGDEALVRNHIRNLRRKLEKHPDRPAIIISSHGRGYSLNALVDC